MFTPTWESLDKRPLPEWFQKATFGIMIHWGPYSVPAYCEYQPDAPIQNGSEWYLRRLRDPSRSIPKDKDYKTIKFHKEHYPDKDYYDFGTMLNADQWDPDAWASLFKNSGAQYVVITSKHHDAFTLFPHSSAKWKKDGKMLPWCSTKVGPKRDIIADLATAVRKVGLKFGVYYSLLEWYPSEGSEDKFIEKIHSQIRYLVTTYQPEVLWLDGHWAKTADSWKIRELLCWIYNESVVKDTIVINDRLGKNEQGKHGDFYNFSDRFIPDHKISHKWECVYTISPGWGANRLHKKSDWKSFGTLLRTYKIVKEFGGSLLLNVGPDSNGIIPPEEVAVLLKFGEYFGTYNDSKIIQSKRKKSNKLKMDPDDFFAMLE